MFFQIYSNCTTQIKRVYRFQNFYFEKNSKILCFFSNFFCWTTQIISNSYQKQQDLRKFELSITGGIRIWHTCEHSYKKLDNLQSKYHKWDGHTNSLFCLACTIPLSNVCFYKNLEKIRKKYRFCFRTAGLQWLFGFERENGSFLHSMEKSIILHSKWTLLKACCFFLISLRSIINLKNAFKVNFSIQK